MWNAISLVQDLNSYHRVHFLRRKPLHHEHLHKNWLFSISILTAYGIVQVYFMTND